MDYLERLAYLKDTKQLEDTLASLVTYREERGLDKQSFDLVTQAGRLIEEVSEFLLSGKSELKKIDALCDVQVFAYNALAIIPRSIMRMDLINNSFSGGPELIGTTTEFRVIMGSYDILELIINYLKPTELNGKIVLSADEATVIGLIRMISVADQCMLELSYCPHKCLNETVLEISSRVQDPEQAIEWAETGPVGKWQKDKKQDPYTLYEANYASCKL